MIFKENYSGLIILYFKWLVSRLVKRSVYKLNITLFLIEGEVQYLFPVINLLSNLKSVYFFFLLSNTLVWYVYLNFCQLSCVEEKFFFFGGGGLISILCSIHWRHFYGGLQNNIRKQDTSKMLLAWSYCWLQSVK